MRERVVSSPTWASRLQPKAETKGRRSVLGNESERGLTAGSREEPAVRAGPADEDGCGRLLPAAGRRVLGLPAPEELEHQVADVLPEPEEIRRRGV